MTQRGITANDHNIFFMGSYAQCTTTIDQHDGGDESNFSFLGQTNLYSIISCNIQGLTTKKQKHKVQLMQLKLCRLVIEFGRVCERRKLRVDVGKSKVTRCSRYGNGGPMHVILNGEPLEEVNCFKYLGRKWQLMEDVTGMWYTE